MTYAKQLEPPPRPPCDDCRDVDGCVMRGALCREMMEAWTEGVEIKGCTFYGAMEPERYHGVEGCRP